VFIPAENRNVLALRVRNGLVYCFRTKTLRIRRATTRSIPYLVRRVKKCSHLHRHQSLPFQSPSSPDFSTSTSEDWTAVQYVAGQQPPPPYPPMRFITTLPEPSVGKSVNRHVLLWSPLHLAFCICSSRNLLLGYLLRQIATTKSTSTYLTTELLCNLTWSKQKCLRFGCDVTDGA
jgi:hypothetical protein